MCMHTAVLVKMAKYVEVGINTPTLICSEEGVSSAAAATARYDTSVKEGGGKDGNMDAGNTDGWYRADIPEN